MEKHKKPIESGEGEEAKVQPWFARGGTCIARQVLHRDAEEFGLHLRENQQETDCFPSKRSVFSLGKQKGRSMRLSHRSFPPT